MAGEPNVPEDTMTSFVARTVLVVSWVSGEVSDLDFRSYSTPVAFPLLQKGRFSAFANLRMRSKG